MQLRMLARRGAAPLDDGARRPRAGDRPRVAGELGRRRSPPRAARERAARRAHDGLPACPARSSTSRTGCCRSRRPASRRRVRCAPTATRPTCTRARAGRARRRSRRTRAHARQGVRDRRGHRDRRSASTSCGDAIEAVGIVCAEPGEVSPDRPVVVLPARAREGPRVRRGDRRRAGRDRRRRRRTASRLLFVALDPRGRSTSRSPTRSRSPTALVSSCSRPGRSRLAAYVSGSCASTCRRGAGRCGSSPRRARELTIDGGTITGEHERRARHPPRRSGSNTIIGALSGRTPTSRSARSRATSNSKARSGAVRIATVSGKVRVEEAPRGRRAREVGERRHRRVHGRLPHRRDERQDPHRRAAQRAPIAGVSGSSRPKASSAAEVKTVSGKVLLATTGPGSVAVRTVSGKVEIRVPRDRAARRPG